MGRMEREERVERIRAKTERIEKGRRRKDGRRKKGEERKVEEVKGVQRWVIRESSYYKTAIHLLAYHCMFNTAKPMRDVGNPQTCAAQEEITWVSCADQQTHTLFVTCFASFLMPSSYNLFMQLLLAVL